MFLAQRAFPKHGRELLLDQSEYADLLLHVMTR